VPSVKPRVPILQRNHPLARGLQRLYALGEGAGGLTRDLAGSGLVTFQSGSASPTWEPGPHGNAVAFDKASSQYASISSAYSRPSATSPFTFAMLERWRPNTTQPSEYPGISSSGYVLSLGISTSASVVHAGLYTWNSAATIQTTASAIQDASNTSTRWHVIAGTYDGSVITCWVDGVAGTPQSVASVKSTSASIDRLGTHRAAYFSGWIGAAGIWDRALSGLELSQLTEDWLSGRFSLFTPPRKAPLWLGSTAGCTATLAATLAGLSLSATGTAVSPASSAGDGSSLPALAGLSLSATATAGTPAPAAAAASVTFAGLSLSASGTFVAATPAAGTLAATFAGVSLSATATASAATASAGVASLTLADLALSATATAGTPAPSAATLAVTLAGLTLAATATAPGPGAAAGSLALTLAGLTVASDGTIAAASASVGTLALALAGIAVMGGAEALAPGQGPAGPTVFASTSILVGTWPDPAGSTSVATDPTASTSEPN
jgi:hypothetical protein